MNTIKYQVLDKSWLPKVYRLAHDSNIEAGHITKPKPDGMLINHRDLDESGDTLILGAGSDQLMATSTITLDGPAGLDPDGYFPKKMGLIRGYASGLGSTWRIAAKTKSRRVILNLIRFTFETALDVGMKTSVMMLNESHFSFYQRLLGAGLSESRTIKHLDGEIEAGLLVIDVAAGYEKLKQITRG